MKSKAVRTLCSTSLLFAVCIGSAFADEKTLPGITSTRIEVMKKDPSVQICMDCVDAKDASKEPRILSEAGRRGVSMQCSVTNNGHTVRITVQNTNSSVRSCSSNCYYRDDRGYDGVQRCQGAVAGNYNGLFCDGSTSNRTYTITNVGAFDCD